MWRKVALYLLAICPIIAVLWFIMTYGMSRYPYADTTITLADTAIHASDNRLTLDDIFATHYRHRIVFSRLFTILLTHLNRWDVRYEVLLNVGLGIINSGLIGLLLWRTWGGFAPLMLCMTTFLMLNLDQALNWLSGLQNSWGFVTLFSLLAIHLSIRQHALSFIGTLVCAICASLSSGNGILIWWILVMVLWLNKNRHLWRYIALVLGGGISVFIILSGGLDVTGNQYQALQFGDIPYMLHIWLLMHSRPFLADVNYQLIPNAPQTVYFAVSQTTVFSILPALIGLSLFGYTTWCISRRHGIQSLTIPLSISLYASGTLAMIAFITPLQTMTNHIDKIILALTERYLYVSGIFWLTLMSLTAWYWRYAYRPYKILVRLVLLILIGLHIHTLIREIPYISFNELAFPLNAPLQHGQCAETYILTGDRSCIYASWMTDWDNLNQLASQRLAGYAHLPVHTLIPHFSPDDMLILNSESAWQSVHLRDFFFNDIPEQAIVHIAPSTSKAILTDIAHSPNPPTHWLFGHEEQKGLLALLTDKLGVWYVIRPPLYQGEALPDYRTALERLFVPAGHIITPENIQLTRYIRPFETANKATFGDDIHLMGYQLVGDAHFEACDTIILQTAWMTDNIHKQAVQLSLALTDDPITRAITNTDSALSPIPIQFWEQDKIYYDERHLTIPCDLPAENYLLTLTVYPMSDAGEVLPNLPTNSPELRVHGHLLVIGEVIID